MTQNLEKTKAVFIALLFIATPFFKANAQVIKVQSNQLVQRSNKSTQYLEIPVLVVGTQDTLPNKDIIVRIQPAQGSTLPDTIYSIINSPLIFPAREFRFATDSVMKKVVIKLLPDTQYTNNYILALKFTADTSHKIEPAQSFLLANAPVKPKDPLDDKSPIRWAVGANFDFLDGLKPNHLYTSLDIFYPELLGVCRKENSKICNKKYFGLYLSMSRNRYANLDSTNQRTLTYYTLTANGDSTWQIRESYKEKVEVTTNTLGIFVAPTFKLPERNDNFDWFVHGHAGGLQVNEQENYSYETLSVDTLGKATLPARKYSRPDIIKKPSYDTYFGGGLTLVNRYKSIETNLAVTFGRANNRSHIKGEVEKQLFYLVQFRVTEFKSGFTLGSELRAFMPTDYPMISIHLSKVFDITKVGEALFN